MNDQASIKRFVAGAVCPECRQLDTTVCYYETSDEAKDDVDAEASDGANVEKKSRDMVFIRECVECDFVERITGDEVVQDDEEAKPKRGVAPAQIIGIKEL